MIELVFYLNGLYGLCERMLVDEETQVFWDLPFDFYAPLRSMTSGAEFVKGGRYLHGHKVLDKEEFDIMLNLFLEKSSYMFEIEDPTAWLQRADKEIKDVVNSAYASMR